MSGISEWLAAVGLDRYASAFEDAEVDVASLALLTDDDLRELKIPLGPRRMILARRDEGAASAIENVATGERRQITVMFVDLVDSTNMSTRFDPEILGEIMERYKVAVAGEVEQAGGTVAKYLGDGVLAYFGWPKAREDAAECAIHCAFQIRDRIKQLHNPAGEPLLCRTGIATGLAVIGGTTGSGNAREESVSGEVLNLSARLQALAEPDGICVSARVREMVGQLFEFEFAGDHALKGFDSSIAAWRPLREAPHSNRFAAKNPVRRSLAGREDELTMLTSQWAQVLQGDGRASVILGEAGIGKSRLLDEFRVQVGSNANILGWQCSAFHQTKPLYPIIEQITRAAEIIHADDGPTRLGKLEALLVAADMPVDGVLPLFANLLSLPIDAGYALLDLTPAQRRSATIAALGDWIRRIAEATPLLLDLEDAHWADASTLEVINLLINGLSGVPLMVVVTGRPEFAAPWAGRAKVMVIGLGRLNDAECEGMIREIMATQTVPSTAILKILEHSDGNPLFVEELSAAFALSGPSDHQTVPETLQGSLMARLDQLGDAKRTAQLCAVLGRHFARPLLVPLSDSAPALIDTNLSLLVANDIVHPLGRANEGRFRFKHALVRDAAYESLLLAERRRLHERCGRQLESAFPEVVEAEPELLAYHFREAGMPSDAATYLDLAGDRASNTAGYIEAVASYREGLKQLAKLTENDDRARRELSILLKLGPSLSIIDGAQGTSVREVYARAEELGRAVHDLDGRFKALWGLWYNANVGRDYSTASEFADELVALSEQSHDDAHRLEALHCRWSSALFRGECLPCISDAALGADLYRPDQHHRLAALFGGHDPGVCAYGCSASSLATAGQFDIASRQIDDGLALAEQLGHPNSTAHALMNALTVASAACDFAQLERRASALGAIAQAYNFPPQRAVAAFFHAWATVRTGESDLAPLRTTFDNVVRIGPMTLVYVALYAEELLKRGHTEESLSVIDQFVGSLKFPFGLYLPEIYRVRGECLAELDRRDEALAEWRHAGDLAASQGSDLFALRIAGARARACQDGADRTTAMAAVKRSLARIGPSDWPEILAARQFVTSA